MVLKYSGSVFLEDNEIFLTLELNETEFTLVNANRSNVKGVGELEHLS